MSNQLQILNQAGGIKNCVEYRPFAVLFALAITTIQMGNKKLNG